MIADIKPPINLPFGLKGWLIALIAVILVFIISAVLFLRKNKKAQSVIFLRQAHEIAYEELAALQAKNLLAQGKIKEYYFEISGIIRRYIENRFNIMAAEMTTEEFLFSLKGSKQLDSARKDLLRGFLEASDLVKFAKYSPAETEINAAYEAAKKFVDETKEIDA